MSACVYYLYIDAVAVLSVPSLWCRGVCRSGRRPSARWNFPQKAQAEVRSFDLGSHLATMIEWGARDATDFCDHVPSCSELFHDVGCIPIANQDALYQPSARLKRQSAATKRSVSAAELSAKWILLGKPASAALFLHERSWPECK